MTKQFTPADREEVVETVKNKDYVHQTTPLGPGVLILCEQWDDVNVRAFTDVMETFGWYVASFDKNDNGDRFTIMPVTEVPE